MGAHVYRSNFKPSATLDKPYVIVGIPLIAAPTDDEAQYLASSTYQRVLGILTGDRKRLQPPLANYLSQLNERERAGIEDFLGAAVIGGPDAVRAGLAHLSQLTGADKFMLVCDIFAPLLRVRSLEIVAAALALSSNMTEPY